MNTTLQAPISTPKAAVPKKTGWRRFGGKFLIISIAVHLLFGLVATLYIVQNITAKRKLTFKAGPPSPNPSSRATEHRVQMAKKQTSMSAPAQSKRIVSTGMSKVNLPEMPAMPSMSSATTSQMAGMNSGLGIGTGLSSGATRMGGGSGSPVPSFGFTSQPKIGSLKGTLIDFKQLKDRKASKLDAKAFSSAVVEFAKGGLREGAVSKFYQSTKSLYTTQFFIPLTPSEEGPKAFNLKGIVEPNLWIIHYKGKVSPPNSGTYYFVGKGDDFMYVKFQSKIVLDSGWSGIPQFLKPTTVYNYDTTAFASQFKRGEPIRVEAGKTYDMEVVIGDQGGITSACLLIEQEGFAYKKDSKGNPILPPFRLAPSKLPPPPKGTKALAVMEDGPIWSATLEKPTSALDAIKTGEIKVGTP